MSLISPYKNTFQYTKIKLEPHHLNSDILTNLEYVLKQKIEKKCNKNGFIDEIYEITEFKHGVMVPENLSGCAIFDIKYHCRLCIPIKNSVIIAQVKTKTQEMVICTNGPLFIFIPKDKIDKAYWDVLNNFKNKETGKNLNENDYVKVLIIDSRINQNGFVINTIGRLLDSPTADEVKNYYGNIVEEEEEENNFL